MCKHIYAEEKNHYDHLLNNMLPYFWPAKNQQPCHGFYKFSVDG